MRIFLDMDGVMVDFVGSVLRLVRRPDLLADWRPRGCYDLTRVLGVPHEYLWENAYSNVNFWRNMQPYPWLEQLLDTCRRYGPIAIASDPSLSPEAAAGKIEWMTRHVPASTDRLLLTSHKYLLANANSVLIDDSDKNIVEFRRAGGQGILFPQPWNSLYRIAERGDGMSYVMQALNRTARWLYYKHEKRVYQALNQEV